MIELFRKRARDVPGNVEAESVPADRSLPTAWEFRARFIFQLIALGALVMTLLRMGH